MWIRELHMHAFKSKLVQFISPKLHGSLVRNQLNTGLTHWIHKDHRLLAYGIFKRISLSITWKEECLLTVRELCSRWPFSQAHYGDVIMGTMVSQITSLTIVYSTVYSGADQRKHQSPASLAFVWGIHRGSVNSPHKWPVTRKMFSFDDVIMYWNHRNPIPVHMYVIKPRYIISLAPGRCGCNL